jgi:hypothetical protein
MDAHSRKRKSNNLCPCWFLTRSNEAHQSKGRDVRSFAIPLQPHLINHSFSAGTRPERRLCFSYTWVVWRSEAKTPTLQNLEAPKCYLITRGPFSALWISFETDGLAAFLIKRGKVATSLGKISLLSAVVVLRCRLDPLNYTEIAEYWDL